MRVERTLQPFSLADYWKRVSCCVRLEVELESMEGRMGTVSAVVHRLKKFAGSLKLLIIAQSYC